MLVAVLFRKEMARVPQRRRRRRGKEREREKEREAGRAGVKNKRALDERDDLLSNLTARFVTVHIAVCIIESSRAARLKINYTESYCRLRLTLYFLIMSLAMNIHFPLETFAYALR